MHDSTPDQKLLVYLQVTAAAGRDNLTLTEEWTALGRRNLIHGTEYAKCLAEQSSGF